jgi:hypothetical protein
MIDESDDRTELPWSLQPVTAASVCPTLDLTRLIVDAAVGVAIFGGPNPSVGGFSRPPKIEYKVAAACHPLRNMSEGENG